MAVKIKTAEKPALLKVQGDFTIESFGSVWRLTPVKEDVWEWFHDNVEEFQRFGRGIMIGNNYVDNILVALGDAGFAVSEGE